MKATKSTNQQENKNTGAKVISLNASINLNTNNTTSAKVIKLIAITDKRA